MTIPINSIVIPERFVSVASRWYSGVDDMLYAVCSTGGLTIGTSCPVSDYTDLDDRDRKWYLTLWRGLSADIGYARHAANKVLLNNQSNEDFDDYDFIQDYNGLAAFENWVDNVIIPRLEDSYGLADWEVHNA